MEISLSPGRSIQGQVEGFPLLNLDLSVERTLTVLLRNRRESLGLPVHLGNIVGVFSRGNAPAEVPPLDGQCGLGTVAGGLKIQNDVAYGPPILRDSSRDLHRVGGLPRIAVATTTEYKNKH